MRNWRRCQHLTHQHPLLAKEPVHEQRLPHVGPADDRETDFTRDTRALSTLRLGRRGARPAARQPVNDLVKQVPDAQSVFSRDLHERLEPEPVKLHRPATCAPVVGLVHGQDHRDPHDSGHLRDLLITCHRPFSPIHHKDDEGGGAESGSPTAGYLRVEGIGAGAEHAASVHQPERDSPPVGRLGQHVSRRARHGRDNGPARADHPVEERRFPHVGPADQDHGRTATG